MATGRRSPRRSSSSAWRSWRQRLAPWRQGSIAAIRQRFASGSALAGLWRARFGLGSGKAALALAGLLPLPGWMDVSVAYTAQPLVSLGGGAGPASAWIQEAIVQLTVSTGLSKDESQWTELDRWNLSVIGSQVWGNNNLADSLGAIFPLQSTALPVQTYLSQLTLERKAPVGGIGVKLGLMSVDPEMLSAPVYDFYVHSAIDATYNIAVPGYTISPYSNPGVLFTYRPTDNTELRYGFYNLNSTQQLDTYGVETDASIENINGWLQILQFSKRWPAPDRRLKERQVSAQLPDGLLQLGGYWSSSSTPNLGPFRPLSPIGMGLGPSQGSYANLTLPVDLPFGLAHRFWAGALVSFSPDTNPLSVYGQVGWLAQGMIPSRPQDVLVLGYGRSVFAQGLGLYDECVLELGYQIVLAPQLIVQPTLQWIFNPGGNFQYPNITTAGVQLQLQF